MLRSSRSHLCSLRLLRVQSLVLALGCAAVLGACSDTEKHLERVVIEEPVQAITVDVGSGDLDIIGGEVSEIVVTARITGLSNHLGHELEDGRLTLFEDCHESECGVDIATTVPFDVPIVLRTGSGDIYLEGMQAGIVLGSGSGDIAGNRLLGVDFSARTGSGDVDLEIDAAAERVFVETDSGDIALTVPGGSYRLSVTTGAGDEHVSGVGNDPNAASSLEVRADSGDVSIRGR
jgi:hypothetical protein